MASVWTFDDTDGRLAITTGTDGVAARMGHRLTIAVRRWRAQVTWHGEQPSAVSLTADVDSLTVENGEGGVTPLSAPERAVARANALKALDARRFPTVTFDADTVAAVDGGYRLTGQLQIHGRRRAHTVDVAVTEDTGAWAISSSSAVCQSDFGVKQYSMMMGSLKVADTVTVTFAATRPTA
jgi:polyisoprenoid-binding protein YceI